MIQAATVGFAVIVFAACGGSGERAGARSGSSSGAQVFVKAGCGKCHALAAAGSKGAVGPNLDELRPSRERVERQVREGGRGMPPFAGTLSKREIEAVADFVASSAKPSAGRSIGFKPDLTTLADCERKLDPLCYRQAFGNLAFSRGPKVALEQFQEQTSTNRAVEADCHPIAHTIGAAALLYYKGNVGRAFAAGSVACGSGYYHGLLEWKLAGVSEQRVAGVARTVCSDPEIRANSFTYYQCIHGLGHGLMLYTQYDLPGALRLCHQLSTRFDQVSCTGGIFMENQQSSYGLTSKWLRKDNLLYPCTIVAKVDKLYCYLLVTSQILPRVSYDWKKTAEWCRRSDPGFVDICFQSYGRDASGFARQDPNKIRETCGQAGDGGRECLFGAVRDILNNNSSDLGGRRLCESVSFADRSYCFFGIGTILGTVYGAESGRRLACARFAGARDFPDCMNGAAASAIRG